MRYAQSCVPATSCSARTWGVNIPLYNVACRKPLTASARQQVATTISRVHCQLTDAPPAFVNVVYLDNQPLKTGFSLSIIPGVRSGGNRDEALLTSLSDAIKQEVATAAGLKSAEVEVQLLGFQANWVMEGGEILPEPGAEGDEWYALSDSE